MRQLLLASMSFILAAALVTPARAAFEDLEQAFHSFYATGLDTENAVGVENLTLKKDAMTLVLKKGIVVPMMPIEGEVTGAFFMGEGTASLTPPTKMDATFLQTHYGAEQFSEDFSELFMRFTDGTDKAFPKDEPGVAREAVAAKMQTIEKSFQERQELANGWLYPQFDMDMDFLDSRIGGIAGLDYFYGQFKTEKWDWITFLYHPGNTLEISLGHDRSIGIFKEYMPWAGFHRARDYQNGRYLIHPRSDTKEILDITKNVLNISIPTTKSVLLDARITLMALESSVGCLRFDFLNQFGEIDWRNQARPIIIDSVTDSEGNPLDYLHKRNQLLIRLPQPISRGQEYTLRIKATEDIIQQLTAESYMLLNTYPWFPWYGYNGGRAAFDFTVEVKHPLKAIGSGHIVREWEDEERKMNGIQLKMDESVWFPSILFGRFNQKEAIYTSTVSNRDIHLSVYAFPRMTDTITDPNTLAYLGRSTPFNVTLTVPVGKMNGILEESQQIIKFYEELFGPFPYGDLQIAQMAPQFGFGQAPPSLIQLTGIAFLSQADLESDMLHGFLSHEIAHQYWAHAIGWANDRDVWLSESFAEYSSGLYIQALQGDKRFQQQLSDWKKNARQADPFGPIALANELSGDNASKYRTQLLYNKGPLIVHMIRMQIGNDNFVQLMKNLMSKYKNQNITTEMLEIELANVTRYHWDYFFDQWFRDIGMPEIHYKYEVKPEADKYHFTMTVSQADEGHFKKFFLPVQWEGRGKEQVAIKDFPIGEQNQVIEALLPFKPKKVEIDPNHNLYAEIVWDK